jgi:D-glycero-D-manno-heptose 1,7-bisphosphate phosphatase
MKAIFLDRDGVICENRSDHVKRWAEFRFLPGAKESLAALSRTGLPIIVVTNQAIINRNISAVEEVEKIHRRMVAEVTASGGRIDRVIYCPHRPDENCNCRKPKSGMLLQAAREMGLELVQSYMVGDAATDIIAGHQVGCQPILVLTGRGFQQLIPTVQAVGQQVTITHNLMTASLFILKTELVGAGEQWKLVDSQSYPQPIPAAAGLL